MGWPALTTVTEADAKEASPQPSRRHEDDTPAVRLQPAEYTAGPGVKARQLAHAHFHAEVWKQLTGGACEALWSISIQPYISVSIPSELVSMICMCYIITCTSRGVGAPLYHLAEGRASIFNL